MDIGPYWAIMGLIGANAPPKWVPGPQNAPQPGLGMGVNLDHGWGIMDGTHGPCGWAPRVVLAGAGAGALVMLAEQACFRHVEASSHSKEHVTIPTH